jgi:hypothetical protein
MEKTVKGGTKARDINEAHSAIEDLTLHLNQE